MIWSVSTLARSSGATRPVCWVKAFIVSSLGLDQFAHIDKTTSHRRRRSHRRAYQVSTPTGALTAFEVTVGGGCAMLAAAQLVRVHRQAHGAARLTPLKAGFDKDVVQTFLFRLGFDQTGTWHHHRLLDGAGDLTTLGHFSSGAQVFDTRVGAGADKHAVQLDIGDRLVSLQAHIFQGAGN